MIEVLVATGHRPQKLGGYKTYVQDRLLCLAKAVIQHHQPRVVVAGGALGWDQAIMNAAYMLEVPYHAIIPFTGYEARWPASTQRLYQALLNSAQYVEYVGDRKEVFNGGADRRALARAMHQRNDMMLQYLEEIEPEQAVLAALWDGGLEGGTYHTVQKAMRKNLQVVNYWSSWVKHK